MIAPKAKPIGHLHLLDALRGIAALSVVCFHYANFMTVGNSLDESIRSKLPFARYLFLFFDSGWLAVDLFFTISGFVFFWLYSEAIFRQQINAKQFFLLRLSRLYPLHLATLIIVAILQAYYGRLHPDLPFFQTRENDTAHFLLQLVFASNWLERFGYSFNSPIWSVSIEVLLYIFFFFICTQMRPGAIALTILCVIGWWAIYRSNLPLGRGVGSFFAGGIAYRFTSSAFAKRRLRALICSTIIIWMAGTIGIALDWSFLPEWIARRARYYPVALMFPSIVVSLALIEQKSGFGKSFSWLGNISYSTYLIHFPLQLALVILVDVSGAGRQVFYSPATFIGFFVLLIPLSWACFRWFEKPAQRFVRNFFSNALARRELAASGATPQDPRT